MLVAAALRSTVWVSVEVPTFPPPKNCAPPLAGPLAAEGKPMKEGRSGIGEVVPIGQPLRGVPYWITVGVPVTSQPGMETVLLPDNDASPTSAPGLLNRFGPWGTDVGVGAGRMS